MSRTEYLDHYGITDSAQPSLYRAFGKRCLDYLICVPVAILWAPLVAVTAVLIKLDSKGPVFFVQARRGRFGVIFQTLKFRTMTDQPREATGEILPGHSEVTRVGKWLRRFKIDELPQLLNILRGDMSLIGPRPALPEHILDYNDDGLQRLLERPGLTGLAQVSGNIYLSWEDRWILDAQYVQSVSSLRDVRILLKTVAVIFVGEETFLRPVIRFSEASESETSQLDESGLSETRKAA